MQKSKSLLIIEDDPDLRMTLEYFLGKIGYKVLTAKTCEDGLKVLAKEHPRAVLCDIMLPGVDGYEACKRIKEDPATRDTAVIFISARDGSEIEKKGSAAKADFYIQKPVDPNDVGADLYYLFEQDFQLSNEGTTRFRVTKKIPAHLPQASQGGHHESHAGAGGSHQSHSYDDFDDEFGPSSLEGAPPKPHPVGKGSDHGEDIEQLDISEMDLSNLNLSEVHQLLQSLRDSLKDTSQRLEAILQYIEVIEQQ